MSIKLYGLEKIKNAIKGVGNIIDKKVNSELEKSAVRIVSNAKARLAPFGNENGELVSDINEVRASIGYAVSKEKYEVTVFAGGTSKENMHAYLEFGTGKFAQRYLASIDPKYRDVAMKFYVNGKGTLRPHPYLIPAYSQEKKRLISKLLDLKISW